MVSEFDRVICSTDISKARREELLNGAVKADYSEIKDFARENCPQLFDSLALDYPNPYAGECLETPQRYVLVHSMKEYFIRK